MGQIKSRTRHLTIAATLAACAAAALLVSAEPGRAQQSGGGWTNGSTAVRRLLPAATGAVVGGTGAYAGARGSVAVEADDSGPFGVVELLP